MAVEVIENFIPERLGTDSADTSWTVLGTNNVQTALMALKVHTPAYLDVYGDLSIILTRDDISAEALNEDSWHGTVRYVRMFTSGYSFEIGGGSQHVTNSLATVHSYAPPGKTAPDCKGAIGVTQDAVEGCDILVPAYNFSESHFFDVSLVTPAYKALIAALTRYPVNNAPFKGFAAGEVLFLGASGQMRGPDGWDINFRFSASQNFMGLAVGDISGIEKRGWDYLWIRYEDAEDPVAKMLVKKPVAVYVEQVYRYGDFSVLGIGV